MAELRPTEREMLGIDQTIRYSYHCSSCQHDEAVPDVTSSVLEVWTIVLGF